MSYRTSGVYWVPKTKKDLIMCIRPQWKGTVASLQAMDKKQLLAIFHRLRQEIYGKFMKSESVGTPQNQQTNTEV